MADQHMEVMNFQVSSDFKKLAHKAHTALSAVTSGLNLFISFGAYVPLHLDSSGAALSAPLILIHLALNYTILPRWKLQQMDR